MTSRVLAELIGKPHICFSNWGENEPRLINSGREFMVNTAHRDFKERIAAVTGKTRLTERLACYIAFLIAEDRTMEWFRNLDAPPQVLMLFMTDLTVKINTTIFDEGLIGQELSRAFSYTKLEHDRLARQTMEPRPF
jgi:hypothetical protein